MTYWETYHLDELFNVRKRPGCYVWICEGRAMYVGQSVDVRLRCYRHAVNYARHANHTETPWGEYPVDTVFLKVCYSRRFGDWLMKEARLIARLRPKGNIHGCNRKRQGCPSWRREHA